jgi:hypothetical protein
MKRINQTCWLVLIFFTILSSSSLLRAEENKEGNWGWIYATSSSNKWIVYTGKAKVNLDKDGHILADLYDEKNIVDDEKEIDSLHYLIKGNISFKKGEENEGRIKANVTTYASDYGDKVLFEGTYFKTHMGQSKSNEVVGREIITLSDGLNFIGLTKDIPNINSLKRK